MKKTYLLAPGPTPVPPQTLLSMSGPIPHHRTKDFEAIFEEVRAGLKALFQTQNDVLIFASSGTGAMEGTVTNLLSKEEKALVVRGGKFGERWAEICEAYGVNAIPIDVEWGKAVDPSAVEVALSRNEDIRAVYIQASETSTGVAHPVKEIAEIVRSKENTVLVVDAITAVGVIDLPMDAWGLDAVVGGSQKALMLPPGLAFAAFSDKAWKFAEKSNLPKYYFDFKTERKNQQKNQTAWTPAITLIIGLADTLRQIKAEGLQSMFKRHALLAEATRRGVQAMGLELYAPDAPSMAVTAVKAPAGIDGGAIVKTLRDRYGVIIAGGQSQLKGKIFRIAHLGYFDKLDILTALSALEMTLLGLGFKMKAGSGVGAAIEIFSQSEK